MSYADHFRRIREQFGKPFGEVVCDLAEQGYSRAEVADRLGICYDARFRDYISRCASQAKWKPRAELRRVKWESQTRMNRMPEYRDHLLEMNRKSQARFLRQVGPYVGTLKQLAEKAGIPPRYAQKRVREGTPVEEVFSALLEKRQ